MNIEEYKTIDTSFNEAIFISKVNNIFVKLFTAISLDDLKNVDHFISDDVYTYAQNIIDTYKNNHKRIIYDELNVRDSKITTVQKVNNSYVINIYLQSKYLIYTIDTDNGKQSSSREVFKDYNLVLTKTINAKNQGIAKKCPNCGASMDINNNGLCPYCNSVYKQEDYDWVLTDIKEIN